MRQDADIRNSLCQKYRIDVDGALNKKSKSQLKTEKTVKELEQAYKRANTSKPQEEQQQPYHLQKQ